MFKWLKAYVGWINWMKLFPYIGYYRTDKKIWIRFITFYINAIINYVIMEDFLENIYKKILFVMKIKSNIIPHYCE